MKSAPARRSSNWAETLPQRSKSRPALSAHCKVAVQVKFFQHLKSASDTGLRPSELAEKTSVDVVLLQRIMRHLIAMKVVTFSGGKFFGTLLSNGRAAENYQRSIDFCYDVARPSFHEFPAFFKQIGYELPISLTDGPFQKAHGTQLPFFPWLVARSPHLDEFDNFMSAYRAGKPGWYDPGFYPVTERLIKGFEATVSKTRLVDVGGGRGHDLQLFASQHRAHPGMLVIQDRQPVIDSIKDQKSLPFEHQAHGFFTPQPVHGARAYSLYSI
ncbi:hypothetical protein NX059_012482 [Plenodomus lindquistii]|nr:hypothetical protein NX059_012482 [Plenodomus lindquistii]